MIDLGAKGDLRRFKGIVLCKSNIQKEDASRVWRVGRSHDCGDPFKKVISFGARRAIAWRVQAYLGELLLDSVSCKAAANVMVSLDQVAPLESMPGNCEVHLQHFDLSTLEWAV